MRKLNKTAKCEALINVSSQEHLPLCERLAKKLRKRGVRVIINNNKLLDTGITITTQGTERIITGTEFFETAPHIPNMF